MKSNKFVFFLFSSFPALALASQWTIESLADIVAPATLGTIPYTFTRDINSQGAVLGDTFNFIGGGSKRTFIYQDGAPTFINTPSHSSDFYAKSINNQGSIAGDWISGRSSFSPFLFSNGEFKDLGLAAGYDYGVAVDINNKNQVLGYYTQFYGTTAHFIYSEGKTTNLNLTNFVPTALNDLGQLAGAYNGHASIYSNGTILDIGVLGEKTNYFSSATDINNHGEVVGDSYVTSPYIQNSSKHAFMFSGGSMVDPGTLGGSSSHALRINDIGQIVGLSSTADNQQHAFLYENGVMRDLSIELGFADKKLTNISINNTGQIAFTAVGLHPYPYGLDTYQSFIATPNTSVPEPGALVLSLSALALFRISRINHKRRLYHLDLSPLVG